MKIGVALYDGKTIIDGSEVWVGEKVRDGLSVIKDGKDCDLRLLPVGGDGIVKVCHGIAEYIRLEGKRSGYRIITEKNEHRYMVDENNSIVRVSDGQRVKMEDVLSIEKVKGIWCQKQGCLAKNGLKCCDTCNRLQFKRGGAIMLIDGEQMYRVIIGMDSNGKEFIEARVTKQ